MLSYSNNVTFSNGQGYTSSRVNVSNSTKVDDTPFITCNTDKHYIKWNSSTNLLDPSFKQTILSEYTNNQFPCDDVTVECLEDMNDTSSCDIHFDVTKLPNFSHPLLDASCFWIPVSDIIEIRCDGDCQSSPTQDPTPRPTAQPTNPTLEPTQEPTQEPTVDPTRYPSQPPTNVPSSDPTQSPSASPTQSPTGSPSQPPTPAPSRSPTLDVDDIYDVKIQIEYHCYNLSQTNKEFIVENTKQFVAKFQEIIEQNYFDRNNDLFYDDFWVQVIEINGKNVVFTNKNQRRLLEDDILTLYDLDILGNSPMIISGKIECDNDNGEIIIRKSQTSGFKSDVRTQLQEYFDNANISFSVSGPNGIGTIIEESKFAPQAVEEPEDTTAIYLSILILSIGTLWSLLSFIHRYFYSNDGKPNCGCNKIPKLKDFKSDNSKFWIPFLLAFGIYDFISDANLCVQIWLRDDTEIWNFENILFILAIISVLCIIIPFFSNLWYAVRITKQSAIRNSSAAQTWFASNFPLKFIPLCIICAGTYPVLGLTSSNLFGLEFFDAGLLSSELHELSKIKLKSTVFMENLPQLFIQIIYSYAIRELETATVLAFIASSLSIISSFAIYQAHKTQSEDVEICRYYLWLLFAHDRNCDFNTFQRKINRYKGLRQKLQDSLCEHLGIRNSKPIEIGSITMVNEAKSDIIGCKIHLQQSVTQSDKDQASYDLSTERRQSETIAVNGDRYIKHKFEHYKSKIKQCLLDHFDLEREQQEIKYRVYYSKTHTFSGNDNVSAPTMDKGNKRYLSVSGDEIEMVQYERKQDSDPYNDDNNNEGDSKYSILLKGINEILNENKLLRQMIETNKDNIDGMETQFSTKL